MRIILIAMAGFAVVAGIGVATLVMLSTADGAPLHPIDVPQQVTAPRQTPATTVAPPAPAPTDDAGVPEPPPALWRTDAPAADGEDDDGDDD